MSSDHPSAYDVIIAGAGPVGLFLACELRLAGCGVLVLERAATPASPLKDLPFGLRGLTLPTMDALDRRDLLSPLRDHMRAGGTAAAAPWTTGARRPAGHFAGLQFFRDTVDEAALPWRPAGSCEMLAIALADLESVLTARATALGVTLRYGCAVDGIDAGTDNVVVHAGGESIAAPWLVGCDGGRSTIRKAAGIGFAGTEPEFTGYSLALRLGDPNPLRPGRQHTATGMYTYAPPGIVTMVDFDGGDRHRATPLSTAHIEAVLRRISGSDVHVTGVDLATTWTDRAFLASVYRQGRVLLAGDAAHVHAPLGGQGLNLGLGDAMNLGWKLAAVVTGRAASSLLDSYQQERRPIAEQVLDWSRAQVALLRPGAGTAALRAVVRDLMETRDGATYFASRLWDADLHYPAAAAAHPLVGRSAPDLPLADGRPLNAHLRDGRFVLLDVGPAERLRTRAGRWSDRLDYRATAATLACPADALLIRPDGIVAWAGAADDPALPFAISRIAHLTEGEGKPCDPEGQATGTRGHPAG
ncbi:FAD-dependent monooxygenase [Sphingomonas sp. CLY1604]|uniref:FAD-dependent monooxygenase n=1 Tax=Sphingomonas sp. CLY1604 TaxID=3457786 RepID=UPI003FD89F61